MRDGVTRVRRHVVVIIAAFVAYVPIIASSPGSVGADTKSYLYLDPGRVLANAASLWDSDVALGTVTHQNIGYLWPMGPFYWLFETIGSPDWLAQRVWLGTLLLAAGLGVRFLLRTLDWQGRGLLVAVLAYQLSPYLLDYSARISAVLLPWAGLPWMIALTIRAARNGGWRDPARFALVVVTVGSVNATSLLLVGIAPAVWLIHARCVERSLTTRRMVGTVVRIAVPTLGVSLWWIAGLFVQGGYSLPVTRYTETYQTVASASTAPEVFRGLGYWFFYGNDKFGPWIQPSIEFTQGVWLLFISFGLVVLALLGAALVRWRHRSYFVLLIVLGGLIAVGSHPFDAPSPLGALFKDFTSSDTGLALRSTPRALPMLVLATAVLLGTVVNAVSRRWPGSARVFAALVVAAVVLNNPAVWRVRMIEEHLHRDEDVPEYWLEAIDALDAAPDDGRVMEVPGSDFASYRWGNTVDPITPGFLERGYVARELVPFGSAESADLLIAFDRRFQEDDIDADAIVPVARLLSVGDIVHRADLTFERFRTPRPVPMADLLDNRAGLEPGVPFGEPVANVAGPEQTMIDEIHLAMDPTLPHPAPVTVYGVPDPLEVVRARAATGGTVIVGDAEGIVDAAGAGLVDLTRPLWFGADLVVDDDLRSMVLGEPTRVVITDTNKRRARRWGIMRENRGHVERSGQEPLVDDPTDNRLELFADLDTDPDHDGDDSRTVSLQPGPFRLRASRYGNPVTYTNDDRPARAVDGDIGTAWVVGAFSEARGERLEFAYDQPTSVPVITLVQPRDEEANRRVTEVTIRADGHTLLVTGLDERSLSPSGQTLGLPDHEPGHIFEIELSDLDVAPRANYSGVSPVGFAEVVMGDADPVIESLRTPIGFVETVGADLDDHDLSVVLTRERSNPQEPVRTDPEPEMRRSVAVGSVRTFTVEGAARVSGRVEDSVVDSLLGRAAAVDGRPLLARAYQSLPGDLHSVASMAFDRDLSTAWTGGLGGRTPQWIELESSDGIEFDEIRVSVVVDELHSAPTGLRVEVDDVVLGEFPTGIDLSDGSGRGIVDVVIPASGAGSRVRLRATAVAERTTRDWYSNDFTRLPISIAEIDFGRTAPRFGSLRAIDTGCVALAEVDGRPVLGRVTAGIDAALRRHELPIEGCAEVTVGPEFTVQTTGRTIGLDIDQLVLRSRRDLNPARVFEPVTVVSDDDTSYVLDVAASGLDRWLVLGQSHNDGWEATVDGRSLGAPVLIDGFANGWLLDAGEAVRVELQWAPQRLVERSIVVSVIAVTAALVLAFRRRLAGGTLTPGRSVGPAHPEIRALPLLDRPSAQSPPNTTVIVISGVVIVAAAFLNLPRLPALSLAIGVATALMVRTALGWLRPALLAATVLGLTAVAIMLAQRANRYPPDFGWPQQFAGLHVWGVVAFVLLVADYLVAAVTDDDP